MNSTLRTWWARGLTATLAALYGWIGLAGHGLDRIFALTGAVLVLAALILARRSRPTAAVLLAVGALPLAVASWSSIVAPLIGLLALLLGWTAIRGHATDAPNDPAPATEA
jgi:hypothetical protein